jgi:hypothetical protein
MIIFKIYEAYCLTLTAGPNLTTIKEKTQSKSYFYDSLSGSLQKSSRGDVLLRRRFVTGEVSLRRRFVKETLCV